MIRMKDVAERCRVSETTVSHVVNHTRYVAPETRRKVLETIREAGFYTNAHARRLARGSSDFQGQVISASEDWRCPRPYDRGVEVEPCDNSHC